MKLFEIIDRYKKYFPIIYIILTFFVFFYAREALSVEEADVYEEPSAKGPENHPAKVTLRVRNGNVSREYVANMETKDSVGDLLEHLRLSNSFTFEKIGYIYGTEIDNINGTRSQNGYKWQLYKDEQNITYNFDKVNLEDSAIYTLTLEKQ